MIRTFLTFIFLLLLTSLTAAQTTFDTGTARRVATVTFSGLGTAVNGEQRRCSDCQATDPATGGGAGAWVYADGSKWVGTTHAPTLGNLGTVTGLSVGNASPLFSSTVANSATTPSVTYTLSPQAEKTILAGPASGGAATPTFRALGTSDVVTGAIFNERCLRTDASGAVVVATSDCGTGVGEVTLTGAQTLSNKTLTSPVVTVGSDATGDMYYRSAGGVFTRVPVGTAGQIMTVSAGIPTWLTGVNSFAGRTGAISAATGDYTWAQINKSASSLADLTTRSISDTTGILPVSQGGLNLFSIAAGKLLYASATDTYAPLTLGTNLSITGGVLNAAVSSSTIAASVEPVAALPGTAAVGLVRFRTSDNTFWGATSANTFSQFYTANNQVSLATQVTGNLPVTNLASGTGAAANTAWFGDGTWKVPSGAGDVVGPASATTNAAARFDLTTGKLLKNSVVTIADTTGNMAGVGTLNTHTLPGGTDTFAMLGNAQTFTGIKKFSSGNLVLLGATSGESVLNAGAVAGTSTLTLPTTTDTLVGKATTDTLTNKTLNAESAGNVITQTVKVWLPAAGCSNVTPGSFWDLPPTTGATPLCAANSNIHKGNLWYSDTAGGFQAQNHFLLPSDFTGLLDVRLIWITSATTGNVKWTLSASSTAIDATENDNPAFGSALSITTATPNSAWLFQTSQSTGWSITGIGPNRFLHIKVFRDGADAADTIATDAYLIGLEVTYRRQM